ncbi:hypothetical protein AAC387_Pa10g1587 [Persea americana]
MPAVSFQTRLSPQFPSYLFSSEEKMEGREVYFIDLVYGDDDLGLLVEKSIALCISGDASVMDNNGPSMTSYQGRTGMLSDIVEECRLKKRQFFFYQGRSGMLGDIVKECQHTKKIHLFAQPDQDPQMILDEQPLPKHVMTDNSVPSMHFYQGQYHRGLSGLLSDIVEECRLMKRRCCPAQYQDPQMLDSSLKRTYDGVPNEQPTSEHVKVEHLYDGKKDSEVIIKSSAISASTGNVSDSINDDLARAKSKKPKTKGLSLIELFTSDQIREHINSLRSGQSKSVDERPKAVRDPMNDNLCQLCEAENIFFEKPPLVCSKCVSEVFVNKAELKKHWNNEQTEEPWVQCDNCKGWQHQICALFNGKRNEEEEVEYTCPFCYQKEITSGEREPLSQDFIPGAKDLPRTLLSDHIEKQLFRHLKKERKQRAKMMGESYDEVPGAEGLVIRVLSSVDKKLKVQPEFWEFFKNRNYPSEFPYKSKVIMLFQKIEGVDVCLFSMFVQEFGSECHFPNQRRVYLSYLDSVKYFRPEIKTVNGVALRTFVYHEILIGYLDYCKKRGFTSFYLWASPPLKDDDYILYCHPEIQKTPRCDRLREWYLSMIQKAIKEKVVVGCTNLYDQFFMRAVECKAEVTMAQLPYFDGDYFPGAIEEIIKKEKEKGPKRTRARKTVRCTDFSETLSEEDMLLMQKLGKTIRPMKRNFIMVHLQNACSHCCEIIVSGKRWICNQCENLQLCHKCHDEEEKHHKKDKHPTQNKEKHLLYPVEVKDVPSDTKDKDGILDCGFFDTRHAFLKLCQVNHYQFNTLRRAKHSSMMVLYHLHNPTAPAFTRTCFICFNEIGTNKGWHCETCSEYDVCDDCHHREGNQHLHELTHCLIQAKEALKK